MQDKNTEINYQNSYENPLRFKHPTQYENVIENIQDILIVTECSNYFDKTHSNFQYIAQIRKLCDKNVWKIEFPRQQHQMIKKLFEKEEFSQNNNVDHFLKSIIESDQSTLSTIKTQAKSCLIRELYEKNLHVRKDKLSDILKPYLESDQFRVSEVLDILKKHVKPKPHVNDEYYQKLLEKPVERKSLLYYKEQAVVAATWWLETIINNVIQILGRLNDPDKYFFSFHKKKTFYTKLKLSLTDIQKRVFVTNLADSIWQVCQKSRMSGQPPLEISFQGEFVKSARQIANIDIPGNERIQMRLSAYLGQNGNVTYHNSSANPSLGEIYTQRNPKRPNNYSYNKFEPNLPSDELISYRDILSTITSSELSDSLGLLPKPLVTEILLQVRPDNLSMESACKAIMWNQLRLKETRKHFGSKESNLVKFEFDEQDFQLYLTK